MNQVSSLWSRPGLRLSGVGHHQAFDPGTGPDRYQRALEILIGSTSRIAFASFTFDLDEPGSVVMVPERVETDGRATPGGDSVGADGLLQDDSKEAWLSTVKKAIHSIDSGQIEKVVLSRGISAHMSRPIDLYLIAQRLEQRQSGSHIFLIDGLVGASPELLLSFKDGHVTSVPLAGSADSGGQQLDSPKVSVEHRLAADSVEEALLRSGVSFTRGEPQIIEFEDLRHLATRFSGTAAEGSTFADVLRELHPTAAVAGTPRAQAMEAIRDLEGISRGRYSGPVGWFDRSGNAEFAIALRCGVLDGNTLKLRSGAGIVSGSDPEAELEETNWKFAPMLDALGLSIQV